MKKTRELSRTLLIHINGCSWRDKRWNEEKRKWVDVLHTCPYHGTKQMGYVYCCYHPDTAQNHPENAEFDPLTGFPEFCPIPK